MPGVTSGWGRPRLWALWRAGPPAHPGGGRATEVDGEGGLPRCRRRPPHWGSLGGRVAPFSNRDAPRGLVESLASVTHCLWSCKASVFQPSRILKKYSQRLRGHRTVPEDSRAPSDFFWAPSGGSMVLPGPLKSVGQLCRWLVGKFHRNMFKMP